MLQSSNRNHIIVHINGETLSIQGDAAFMPLAQFLRNHLGKVGTKVVCAEGDCGACTVLTSHLSENTWQPFRAINSCIAPMFLFDQACIVTVEGISSQQASTTAGSLSEVQQKMREHHGGQCGFCTPGMICSLAHLAEDCAQTGEVISEKKARNYLTGNLCRCTGYDPILKAATHLELPKWASLAKHYLTDTLKDQFLAQNADVKIETSQRRAFIPSSISEALELKRAHPHLRIVAGATDLGVVVNKGKSSFNDVLILNQIAELKKIEQRSDSVFIGAQVTLTQLENFMKQSHPEFKRLLHIFASPQIKNQATLLGNILNGSPIGDSIPSLMALDAEIEFASSKGSRRVALKSFYKAYKVFDKNEDEIAIGLHLPLLSSDWVSKFFKVSMRKDLDISAVTFAAVMKVDQGKIAEARLAMGGIGPCVIRLPAVEQSLRGQDFNMQTFTQAGEQALAMITPISDLRASEEYRRLVTVNLFKKCYHELETLCP